MIYHLLLCLVYIGGLIHAQSRTIDEGFKDFAFTLAAKFVRPESSIAVDVKPVTLARFAKPHDMAMTMEVSFNDTTRLTFLVLLHNRGLKYETECFLIKEKWIEIRCINRHNINSVAAVALTIADVENTNCIVQYELQMLESNYGPLPSYSVNTSKCPQRTADSPEIWSLHCELLEYGYVQHDSQNVRLMFYTQHRNALPEKFRPESDPCGVPYVTARP